MARATEPKLSSKAERTRARVLEVALELLATHEFRQLSMDAIAARAGVTKGAVYGHFESKDALLMAAFFSRPETRFEAFDWPTGRDGTVRERLRRLGEVVLAAQPQSPTAAAVGAEFMLYALTHPEMQSRVAQVLGRTRGGLEASIAALFAPEELPMPAKSFAMLLGALIPGLIFSRTFGTGPIDREAVLAMFEGLAGPSG